MIKLNAVIRQVKKTKKLDPIPKSTSKSTPVTNKIALLISRINSVLAVAFSNQSCFGTSFALLLEA
jgi:hypothetical protein